MASRRPTTPPRTPTAVPPPATAADPTPPAAESAVTGSPVKKASTLRKPRAKQAEAAPGKAPSTVEISEDVRRGMIAEAAYLRAERRSFSGGPEKEREDWLAAEAEVDALLKAGHGSSAQ